VVDHPGRPGSRSGPDARITVGGRSPARSRPRPDRSGPQGSPGPAGRYRM